MYRQTAPVSHKESSCEKGYKSRDHCRASFISSTRIPSGILLATAEFLVPDSRLVACPLAIAVLVAAQASEDQDPRRLTET